MTLEELRKLVRYDLQSSEMTPNTVEYASKYRMATKAAYELDDYPVLSGLESTWKLIESDFPPLGKDREDDNYESPVSRFMFNVDMGFYPPPEIMLSLLRCFELYYACGGHKSLDEIFFGKPHKKKSSGAFVKSQQEKYDIFSMFYATADSDFVTGADFTKKSLVERAEIFISAKFPEGAEVDPETFLKGYRRWQNCSCCGHGGFGRYDCQW